jgi:hypothetical protein
VAELGAQRIIRIEVKAGAPTPADGRHLAWLHDEYGDRFLAGIILHTVPFTYPWLNASHRGGPHP